MKKSIEEMSKYFLEKNINYEKTIKNIKLAIKKSIPLDKNITVFRIITPVLNNTIVFVCKIRLIRNKCLKVCSIGYNKRVDGNTH